MCCKWQGSEYLDAGDFHVIKTTTGNCMSENAIYFTWTVLLSGVIRVWMKLFNFYESILFYHYYLVISCIKYYTGNIYGMLSFLGNATMLSGETEVSLPPPFFQSWLTISLSRGSGSDKADWHYGIQNSLTATSLADIFCCCLLNNQSFMMP